MRWRGVVETNVVDIDTLRAMLPLVLDRLRNLEVRDGMLVHPGSGRAMARLKVVKGEHPTVGTVYEAIARHAGLHPDEHGEATVRGAGRELAADDPKVARFTEGLAGAPDTTVWTVGLMADDEQRCELVVAAPDGLGWALSLSEPRRPTALTASGRLPGGSSSWTKGDSTSHIEFRLADFATPAAQSGAPIVGSLRHRRFVVQGEVNVQAQNSSWRLQLDIVGRGRGVARPFIAVLGGLFGWLIRRQLDEELAEWSTAIADEPMIARIIRGADPAHLPDDVLADLLAPFVDGS